MSILRVTGVHTASKILEGPLAFPVTACVISLSHPVGRMGRCLYQQCTTSARNNTEGTKLPAYCKKHAKGGMVDINNRRCSHVSCRKYPYFNMEGSKIAVYCRQHAHDGMVDVRSRRCSHNFCAITPLSLIHI